MFLKVKNITKIQDHKLNLITIIDRNFFMLNTKIKQVHLSQLDKFNTIRQNNNHELYAQTLDMFLVSPQK